MADVDYGERRTMDSVIMPWLRVSIKIHAGVFNDVESRLVEYQTSFEEKQNT